jgi:hypothetical protein
MNNRPGIASLLSAAIITFRIVPLGLILIILPAVAAADDLQGGRPAPVMRDPVLGKPSVILSLPSYDRLRDDFLYLARLAGQDEAAAQLDRIHQAPIVEGIDRSKPIGAYGWIEPFENDSVPLVPVADENAFLRNFNIALRKGGDDVYAAGGLISTSPMATPTSRRDTIAFSTRPGCWDPARCWPDRVVSALWRRTRNLVASSITRPKGIKQTSPARTRRLAFSR